MRQIHLVRYVFRNKELLLYNIFVFFNNPIVSTSTTDYIFKCVNPKHRGLLEFFLYLDKKFDFFFMGGGGGKFVQFENTYVFIRSL